MKVEFRIGAALAAACGGIALLFSCGDDATEQSADSGTGSAPIGGPVSPSSDVTPLVALMRELDLAWIDALDASGWLETRGLDETATAPHLTRWKAAHQQMQSLLTDARFKASQPELELVFGAMRDGMRSGLEAWAVAAESGDPDAVRRSRAAVESSCVGCHRSMRDEAPAKLAASMRRIEALYGRVRENALRIEADAKAHGSFVRLAAAASELATMADSGVLRPAPDAPASHAEERRVFQTTAEALRTAAENRDPAATMAAFGPLGLSCISCHEARNVQIKQ